MEVKTILKIFSVFCGAILVSTMCKANDALTGAKILEKNEHNHNYQDCVADAELLTSGGKRKPGKKNFQWWRKLKSDQKSHDILTRFSSPAEIKNEAILILEKAGEENEVFIYLPKFKKVRRVETRSQNSSFMGSDFSYSDVSAIHGDDWEIKKEKNEDCPFDPSAEKKCFVLDLTPKTEKVKLRTGYKQIKMWIRETSFTTDRIHYFDSDGKLIKQLESGDAKLLDEANKRYFSHKMIMTHLISGQKTEMNFSNVKFNVKVNEKIFSKQHLEAEGG